MQPHNFKWLADQIKSQSGMSVTIDKAYLLDSHLAPVLKKWHVNSLDALVEGLRAKPNQLQLIDIVEAMTINESFFFRDKKPFELFCSLMLPKLRQARNHGRTLRIWSAAAASGQEAYSLAMLVKEHHAELAGWSVEIVGTDLSHDMVRQAQTGIFTDFAIQRGLPHCYLEKHFSRVDGHWQLNNDIRQMVKFKPLNLLHNFGGLGHFDIVFCRNVLIYFEQETKARVLAAIARQMPADGYLVLGSAETVIGLHTAFAPVSGHPGLYMPASTVAVAHAAVLH